MTIPATLEDAIALACTAHKGQLDKADQCYILHPLRVMLNLGADATAEERMTAVLHDVIEDSEITAEDLLISGYPREVVEALELLSKQPGEEYEAFIRRLADHPLARHVKIADLRDNMDLTRIANPTSRDYERLQRYERALEYLQRKEVE